MIVLGPHHRSDSKIKDVFNAVPVASQAHLLGVTQLFQGHLLWLVGFLGLFCRVEVGV